MLPTPEFHSSNPVTIICSPFLYWQLNLRDENKNKKEAGNGALQEKSCKILKGWKLTLQEKIGVVWCWQMSYNYDDSDKAFANMTDKNDYDMSSCLQMTKTCLKFH